MLLCIVLCSYECACVVSTKKGVGVHLASDKFSASVSVTATLFPTHKVFFSLMFFLKLHFDFFNIWCIFLNVSYSRNLKMTLVYWKKKKLLPRKGVIFSLSKRKSAFLVRRIVFPQFQVVSTLGDTFTNIRKSLFCCQSVKYISVIVENFLI